MSGVSLVEAAKISASFEGVTVGGRYGRKTWFVGKKAFAWERPFTKADLKRFGDETPPAGPILAVSVADLLEKEAALAANPRAFFTIPHFDGYAAILVQLDKVNKRDLRRALEHGWRAVGGATRAPGAP